MSPTILITTLEHAFAVAAQKIVAEAKFVESKVLPVLEKAQAQAQTVEAITGLVSPQAANIERVGYAILGQVIKAIEDSASAAAAGGLNVTLDQAVVDDIKTIIPAVKAAATQPAPAK